MKLQYRVFLVAVLAASTCLTLRAADPADVKRGEPQRRANYWEERIDCSAPVREGGRLVVRADLGPVVVKAGANDRMECQVRLRAYTPNETEARRYFKSCELSVRPLEGGGAYLTGRLPQERRQPYRVGAEFNITLPVRFNVDIETKGGDVEVARLEGEFRAVTAGGDIRSGDVTGPVHCETAGGDITLGNIGARLEARTAGGDIRVGDVKGGATLETSGGEIVAGQISGALKAETAGGDVALRGASGPIEARTAGGQIQIGDSGGSVFAQTAGGSIRLQGAAGRVEVKTAGGSIDLLQVRSAVRAATAAGGILAQLDPARKTFSASELEAMVGDVRVYLPPDLPLTIDAVIDQAPGHKIVSDFALDIKGDPENFLIQHTLRGYGALNGGGEVLRIRTVAGNIEIRKLDPQTLEQLKGRRDSFWKQWQEKQEGPKHTED